MPVNDLKEFDRSRQSPAGLTTWPMAPGNGSGAHLSMEAFKQQTGLKLRDIPYKASSAVSVDLMAGHLQVAFSAPATVLPLIKAGKLKAIAISGPNRSRELPDVKTMTEQGVTFDLTAWYGLAPAGTSRAIVDALNREITKVIADPAMAERWKTLASQRCRSRRRSSFQTQSSAISRNGCSCACRQYQGRLNWPPKPVILFWSVVSVANRVVTSSPVAQLCSHM